MSFTAQFDCNEVRTIRGHVYHSSDRPELSGGGPLPTCYFVNLEVPGGNVTLVAEHTVADLRRLAEELRAAADQLDPEHGAQAHYNRELSWQPDHAA
jgi:hypothetical protein